MDLKLARYLKKNHIAFKLHSHAAVKTVAESSANPVIQSIPGLR